MTPERLNAFSDGVIAIIITIMVLELKVPHPLAFVHQLIADALYVLVAMMWLVPDRRIESLFDDMKGEGNSGR